MSNQVHILYVEDDQDIRDIAELVLEDEFELTVCESGEDALSKAGSCTPGLLLLDVMMPGMDGPTTLQNLRELPHLANTPAVFMTAKVQPDEVLQYKKIGAIGVISKPFDPMSLAGELLQLLAGAKTE